MTRLLLPVLLLAACATCPGCQGLAQALGVQPTATAPATVNIGNLVAGRENSLEKMLSGTRMDLSGDTGADGTGSQSAEMTQTVQIDPEAVGKAITDAAKTFTAPAATALLDGAQSELAGGDAKAASRLLKRAAAAEKAAHVVVEPVVEKKDEAPAEKKEEPK